MNKGDIDVFILKDLVVIYSNFMIVLKVCFIKQLIICVLELRP